MYIIDRRLNPGGKSLANRQRFLRRAKALVRRAVRDSSKERSIKDMDHGGEVTIPVDGVREPRFHRSTAGGMRDLILPGNKEFVQGDTIPRPPGGAGGGGSEGSEDGGGEDDFRFVLTQDEYLELFLDDLELPDLAKRKLASIESPVWRRAGYSVSGSPANLSLTRTMRNSLSRRIALRRPKSGEITALEEEIAQLERDGLRGLGGLARGFRRGGLLGGHANPWLGTGAALTALPWIELRTFVRNSRSNISWTRVRQPLGPPWMERRTGLCAVTGRNSPTEASSPCGERWPWWG